MNICRTIPKTANMFLGLAVLSLAVTAGAQNAAAADPYEQLLDYDFGKSRAPLSKIEEQIRSASPAQRAEIEARLIETIESPAATYACKQFVCRMLRRTGTERCVPVLADLLADEKLSHMARFALQEMPYPEVDDVFRKALDQLAGDARIGVIGSIGARRDQKAVRQLARLLRSNDRALVEAALSALGRIGGKQAARAIARANVPDELRGMKSDAYLMCAESLLAEGQTADAANIYRELARDDYPTATRIAAYRGLARAEKGRAVGAISSLLTDKNVSMQQGAATLLAEIPGAEATIRFAEQLPAMAPAAQVVLLGALADRGDKAALPHVARAARSENEHVRVAAVRALGVLGNASTVGLLLDAATSGGAVGEAAEGSLTVLRGADVTKALTASLRGNDNAAARARAAEVLAARRDVSALPALLEAGRDRDATVRRAAYQALGTLAGERELPEMVALMIAAKDSAERRVLERATASVVGRLDEPEAAAQPLISGLAEADERAFPSLLVVLGRAGGDRARNAVREQLDNPNVDIKKAAIRALGNWPDPSPADDLIKIAKNDPDQTCQVLAVQGYVRLIGLPSDRPDEETLEMYKTAMKIARRPDEKKLVLAGVANVASHEALEFVEQYLDDEEIGEEAKAAHEKLADMLEDED